MCVHGNKIVVVVLVVFYTNLIPFFIFINYVSLLVSKCVEILVAKGANYQIRMKSNCNKIWLNIAVK